MNILYVIYISIGYPIIILVLLAYIAWDKHESKLERERLMRMIYAKTHVEYKDLEAIEKIEIKANLPVQHVADEIPVEQMTDEQFDKQIKEAITNG